MIDVRPVVAGRIARIWRTNHSGRIVGRGNGKEHEGERTEDERRLRARVEVAEMRTSYHALIQFYAAITAVILLVLAVWATRP